MRHLLLVLFIVFTNCVCAQNDARSGEGEKPQDGYVRVINAATVLMSEPWKSGVDLVFKEEPLAIDMRGGEGATYRKITSVGRDSVDVISAQTKRKLASVPASFNEGAFYSIIVSGLMRDTAGELKPLIIKDYPITEEKEKALAGRSLVRVFNGVGTFPVKLQIEGGFSETLKPLEVREIPLASGTYQYRLLFPYEKSQREIRGLLTVGEGGLFTALVYASPEKPDRPVMRVWNDKEQARDAMEAERSQEEGQQG